MGRDGIAVGFRLWALDSGTILERIFDDLARAKSLKPKAFPAP
jgi:hypothetical protein